MAIDPSRIFAPKSSWSAHRLRRSDTECSLGRRWRLCPRQRRWLSLRRYWPNRRGGGVWTVPCSIATLTQHTIARFPPHQNRCPLAFKSIRPELRCRFQTQRSVRAPPWSSTQQQLLRRRGLQFEITLRLGICRVETAQGEQTGNSETWESTQGPLWSQACWVLWGCGSCGIARLREARVLKYVVGSGAIQVFMSMHFV